MAQRRTAVSGVVGGAVEDGDEDAVLQPHWSSAFEPLAEGDPMIREAFRVGLLSGVQARPGHGSSTRSGGDAAYARVDRRVRSYLEAEAARAPELLAAIEELALCFAGSAGVGPPDALARLLPLLDCEPVVEWDEGSGTVEGMPTLVLVWRSPHLRLLMHGACQFHGLRAKSETVGAVRKMRVRPAKGSAPSWRDAGAGAAAATAPEAAAVGAADDSHAETPRLVEYLRGRAPVRIAGTGHARGGPAPPCGTNMAGPEDDAASWVLVDG